MGIALALVAAIYAFALGVLGWVTIGAWLDGDRGASLGGLMFLAAIPACLWGQWTRSADKILQTVRARPEPAGDALVPVAERLAAQADVRAPDVLVAHSWTP